MIAADEPEIEIAATEVRGLGASVQSVQADLSTTEGVDKLYEASKRIGRPVDALLANAGRGLGRAFLDQDFKQARRVIDTCGIVTIEKKGNAVTFAIDVNNDGPSAGDMEKTVPDIKARLVD